jgi:hypothetical protein
MKEIRIHLHTIRNDLAEKEEIDGSREYRDLEKVKKDYSARREGI